MRIGGENETGNEGENPPNLPQSAIPETVPYIVLGEKKGNDEREIGHFKEKFRHKVPTGIFDN